jgi:hypothetical protein
MPPRQKLKKIYGVPAIKEHSVLQYALRTWSGRSAMTVAAIAVLAILAVLANQQSNSTVREPAPRIMVLYVGSNDCAPCRVWHREYRPAFVASSWFNRLEYYEALSPTLFEVLKDEFWPDNLHRFRAMLGEKAGVPIWFVVANDEVVLRAGGISQWEAVVLPKLRSLFR